MYIYVYLCIDKNGWVHNRKTWCYSTASLWSSGSSKALPGQNPVKTERGRGFRVAHSATGRMPGRWVGGKGRLGVGFFPSPWWIGRQVMCTWPRWSGCRMPRGRLHFHWWTLQNSNENPRKTTVNLMVDHHFSPIKLPFLQVDTACSDMCHGQKLDFTINHWGFNVIDIQGCNGTHNHRLWPY